MYFVCIVGDDKILVNEKMDHTSLASLIGSKSSMSMQSTEYMNSELQMVTTMWIIAINYIGMKDHII